MECEKSETYTIPETASMLRVPGFTRYREEAARVQGALPNRAVAELYPPPPPAILVVFDSGREVLRTRTVPL